jgi:hypothetical protein
LTDAPETLARRAGGIRTIDEMLHFVERYVERTAEPCPAARLTFGKPTPGGRLWSGFIHHDLGEADHYFAESPSLLANQMAVCRGDVDAFVRTRPWVGSGLDKWVARTI